MIAHRGVHATGATENTIEAFELAVELGADMIEFDVHRSGAGELAILHDPALDGVALASCSLDEFERRTGFRPPLLREVLDWARDRIALDIELKEDGYVDEVAELLAGYAPRCADVIVKSFLDSIVAQLSELAPQVRTGLLIEFSAARVAERARACGAAAVLPEMRLLDEALIAAVATAGLELIVWDFFAAEDAALLSDSRLAGVVTDDVPGAIAARAAAARRAWNDIDGTFTRYSA